MADKVRRFARRWTLLEWLLLGSPLVWWFSYWPSLQFGRSSGMNLEISLSLGYVVVVALSGLPLLWHSRHMLMRQSALWCFGVFVLWNILSVVWSVNPLRTVLTSGVWAALWLVLAACMAIEPAHWRRMVRPLGVNLIAGAVVMSAVAVLQVAYGAWTDWGLCTGCLARGFGFVRPSAFAIEPQFFGSLLLAPILMLMWRQLVARASRHEWLGLGLMIMALYLTLSRGAMIAGIGAGLVLLVIAWGRVPQWTRRATKLLSVIIFGVVTGMMWHALFTELNPRVADGWYDAVNKSVHHLTLGSLSLPKPAVVTLSNPEVGAPGDSASPSPPRALFDGYVERSTSERAHLTEWALQTWQKDGWTMLFGVGAGGAGRAIWQYTGKTGWELEIVQNEYVSVLLELGVIGIMLALLLLLSVIKKTASQRWLWAVMVGYMIQWLFFSGLPNALHIYLVLMLAFVIIDKVYEKAERIDRRVHARKPSVASQGDVKLSS